MKEDFDLESVYDEQIFPLMQQIIEISKKHDLPFIASFQYSTEDGENHNFCSTANLPDTRPISEEFNEIYRVLTGIGRRAACVEYHYPQRRRTDHSHGNYYSVRKESYRDYHAISRGNTQAYR